MAVIDGNGSKRRDALVQTLEATHGLTLSLANVELILDVPEVSYWGPASPYQRPSCLGERPGTLEKWLNQAAQPPLSVNLDLSPDMCTTVCTMEGRPPVLHNPPLAIVAVELRFPGAILLPEDYKKIRRELASEYPASDTEQGIGVELSVQGIRQQATTERQVYRTRDGVHQVALTPTALVLEARDGREYEGFERFLERWMKVLEIVQPLAEINIQLRLGLRYVNQLPVEDASAGFDALTDRINPVLLSPAGAEGFDFSVARSFQELRLVDAQGKATLRHGLQAADDESPPPGAYILDIDYYDDELADYDPERQVERLKLFNWRIWNIFRWSITDSEYERMEPEEA